MLHTEKGMHIASLFRNKKITQQHVMHLLAKFRFTVNFPELHQVHSGLAKVNFGNF